MCIRDRFTGALRLFDALTHTLTCSSIGCRLFDSLHRPACSAQAEVETALFSFKGQTSKSSAGVRLLADSLVEKLPLSRRFRGLSAAKTPALGGGLNGWSQHFNLLAEMGCCRWAIGDGSISRRSRRRRSGTVSYTHLPSPRDGLLSRMPSSA